MDVVIALQPITVDGGNCNAGTGCDLGEVAVFNWFTRLNTQVFTDLDLDLEETGTIPGIGKWMTVKSVMGNGTSSCKLESTYGNLYIRRK